MGKLTALRVVRWAKGGSQTPEYPHLEALVETESEKVADGFHYARWITPLVGLFFAVACFMPLALTVHPLFWLGSVGVTLLGGLLGAVFHGLAMRISPGEVRIRQRCRILGNKMVRVGSLIGVSPALDPEVARVLEEAASIYLAAGAREPQLLRRPADLWTDARLSAERAMDEAMAQMLRLAEPETPEAQRAELARGWAGPLLQEMRATAESLDRVGSTMQGRLQSTTSPIASLADARANLERLESAAAELERTTLQERA